MFPVLDVEFFPNLLRKILFFCRSSVNLNDPSISYTLTLTANVRGKFHLFVEKIIQQFIDNFIS